MSLYSIIFILSPFWLLENKTIRTDALRKELEHLVNLKKETLEAWIIDEKKYMTNTTQKGEWEERKFELKNRYIALSRQEIIYKDSISCKYIKE